jgi:exonuclease III
MYANARSVNNKIEIIHDDILASKSDLICICETWLDSNNSSDETRFQLPGYKLFCNSRQGRKGGGLTFLAWEKFITQASPGNTESCELYSLKVNTSNNTLTINLVYRPPNTHIYDFLADFACLLAAHNDDDSVVIVGDVNLHLNNTNEDTVCNFLTLFTEYEFTKLSTG